MSADILHIDLDALPPLSPLAPRLLQLNWDADDAERELHGIIASEPQLSARLIGLANSVAFGIPGNRIATVDAAIRRIGLRRASQLSVAALFGHVIHHKLDPKAGEALWLHALAVAYAAQEIARIKKLPEPNAAYLLGLMHDLGYMLMEYSRPGVLDELVDASLAENITQEQAEFRRFGAEHQALSCAILEHWEVPAELIEPLRHHHRLDVSPNSLAALVFGAEKLARSAEVVEVLYADLGHPFAPLAMDRLGIEFLFDQQLEMGSDTVSILIERIIDQVDGLRDSAHAMQGHHSH